MKNNLLLMSLRSPYIEDQKIYPPLGLLYLKSAVDKFLPKVNVDLVDEYDLNDFDFSQYSHVGLSVMTPQREEALKTLDKILETTPKTQIIIGGPHANHYLSDIKSESFDYIVPKDGQRALISILQDKASRIMFDKMDKKTWGSMPRPDRTSDKAREFLKGYHYELQGRKAGTMLTATGCPQACTFCEDALTGVRWSPIEKLTAEMDDLIDNGYKGVYLFDDLFAIAMNKVEPIARELNKRDLIYRCNGQANFFTRWGEYFAKLLGDTGCVEIAFGHETGSQKILNNIRKKTTVEQNYKSVEYAKKHGIHVKSFILLGLPGEDYHTLSDTEQFIAESGIDDFQCAIYYPYKGTQIRKQIDKREYADTKKVDLYFEGEGLGAYGQKGGNTESVVRTSKLSSQELLDFRNYLVDKYHSSSHKKHWFDSHLNTKVE